MDCRGFGMMPTNTTEPFPVKIWTFTIFCSVCQERTIAWSTSNRNPPRSLWTTPDIMLVVYIRAPFDTLGEVHRQQPRGLGDRVQRQRDVVRFDERRRVSSASGGFLLVSALLVLVPLHPLLRRTPLHTRACVVIGRSFIRIFPFFLATVNIQPCANTSRRDKKSSFGQCCGWLHEIWVT